MNKTRLIPMALVVVFLASGCTTFQKANLYDGLVVENNDLRDRLAKLDAKGRTAENRLTEMERAKRDLEERLSQQIKDQQASLKMTKRGLEINFLDEIFFESGKDEIGPKGAEALNSVAQVLNGEVVNSRIAVEGYTDNVPIKYSGWKSNWELSSARALAVLHFLIDTAQVDPKRLSAIGYGEFAPVADNATPEGRQKNRRVAIVILN